VQLAEYIMKFLGHKFTLWNKVEVPSPDMYKLNATQFNLPPFSEGVTKTYGRMMSSLEKKNGMIGSPVDVLGLDLSLQVCVKPGKECHKLSPLMGKVTTNSSANVAKEIIAKKDPTQLNNGMKCKPYMLVDIVIELVIAAVMAVCQMIFKDKCPLTELKVTRQAFIFTLTARNDTFPNTL